VNWDNYGSALAQLREAGLLVEDLELGRRMRCRTEGDREKRGWYHLHELPLDDGRRLIVGSFGVWRGNDNGAQKIQIKRSETLSEEQRAAIKLRIANDRKASDAARQREIDRAAARAQAMWQRLDTSGECEYLQRKGVAPHGVRFSPTGAMVLPLLDVHGRVYGLQAIYPRGHAKAKRLGRDKDFWPAGLAKQGHFFMIGSPAGAAVCMLAEGYATAASAHEAVGLPVAVGFDAGNLVHVAAALRQRWPRLRVLVLADDDYLGKCRACGKLTQTALPACTHCGEEHHAPNAGIAAAQATALADHTTWLAPRFAAERPLDRKGPTDWNDLHLAEGLHVVRAQIEAHLTANGWRAAARPAPALNVTGEGDGARGALSSINSVDELHDRYALVYEAAETVFDAQEHKLVPLASMRNLCTSRQLHRAWIESPDKRVVRLEEVGFDPSERDDSIKCNLWAGWPTRPRAGACDRLLALGEYLCSQDPRAGEVWQWLLRWLAYPIQHPGAKMKTAVIMHGPQGTGKNLFFEAVLGVYGTYGQVVDQDAIEDKYNDYMSRKLMLVADEVVARMEMFHAKNKLKGLVTSDWIRINPKFVASYRERNHVNLVFLSNEVQPMALERDDRRYAVIWTPGKWDADMYNAVLREIRDGGIAALHHHLLHLPLGDFGPATLPPMTQAKADLVELGMDSSERFFLEWTKGFLPLPVVAVRTDDLYGAYRHWCTLQGVSKPAQLVTCVGAWAKRPGVRKERMQHFKNYSHQQLTQSMVLMAGEVVRPEGRQQLADDINGFNEAAKKWRDESTAAVKRPGHEAAPAGGRAHSAGGDDEPF
jgi:putative DNA primase/helicase